jgi:hypothetical protein
MLCVGGCAKKEAGSETQAQRTASATPAESNVPMPAIVDDTPAAPPRDEHPIVATTREFVEAVAAGRHARALALSVPGEFNALALEGMRKAFQWDKMTFTQAWLGAEQSAVITDFIPAGQGSATAAWGFNLVAAENGRWLVRLYDILVNQQMIEDYVAAFRAVASDAKSVIP